MSEGSPDERLESFSRAARKMAHLDLSPLQLEILGELVDGNRTMAELSLAIYGLDYKNPQYETYHSRTRRAVKGLEGKGFVSKKKLFGRDKPYGLTIHGAVKITSVIPEVKDPSIITKKDYLLFLVTGVLAVVASLTLNLVITHLLALSIGMSGVRAAHIYRRVL